ncbi:MAG: hypothetical protein V1909_05985 [Candidatus Micrarchaeota archaeon]
METVVRIEGAVELVLERLLNEGYYKTKAEAIRAGILELGREYSLVGDEEAYLVSKKIRQMRAQVKSGKKKMYSIEEIAKEAGVEI